MDGFKLFLNKIIIGDYPAYGTLSWDGKETWITATVKLNRDGIKESRTTIRERAVSYLKKLTPREQASINIEVIISNGAPVRLILKAPVQDLPVERLQKLEQEVGLKESYLIR